MILRRILIGKLSPFSASFLFGHQDGLELRITMLTCFCVIRLMEKDYMERTDGNNYAYIA